MEPVSAEVQEVYNKDHSPKVDIEGLAAGGTKHLDWTKSEYSSIAENAVGSRVEQELCEILYLIDFSFQLPDALINNKIQLDSFLLSR